MNNAQAVVAAVVFIPIAAVMGWAFGEVLGPIGVVLLIPAILFFEWLWYRNLG